SPDSLQRIRSRSEFDAVSRTYYGGRLYALPHVMFAIDRRDHDKTYYINSSRYRFHKDFINASYLSLERGNVFYENNYLKADRRFLLGTVAYQTSADTFTFEFWEGDRLNHELLAEAFAALKESFFAPLFFKPNSATQEAAAASGKGGAAVPI